MFACFLMLLFHAALKSGPRSRDWVLHWHSQIVKFGRGARAGGRGGGQHPLPPAQDAKLSANEGSFEPLGDAKRDQSGDQKDKIEEDCQRSLSPGLTE